MSDLALLGAGLGYLALLFLVAESAERGWLPRRLTEHPALLGLSLGVYATTWTFFGSVGLAHRAGPLYLAIYLGPTLACLAIPVIWLPLAQVLRQHQLSSLADLFAFRYRSHGAGILVTLLMLAALLPYFALQVQAVSDAAALLGGTLDPRGVGLLFCVAIAAFAMLFGVRHEEGRTTGLVVAIAFESTVKIVALLAVGLLAFKQLGGAAGLEAHLAAHPEALARFTAPPPADTWLSLGVLSFAAAFLLPRQFHMAFTTRPEPRAFYRAMWLFPLSLFLLSAVVPILTWAGAALAPDSPADTWVMRVAATRPAVGLLAFVGGISAASAMMVVASLALSSMSVNHLVLPLWRPKGDVRRRVRWVRRGAIALVVLSGYLFHLFEAPGPGLAELGTVTFVAVAQCLPGVFGVLFWPRASRAGLLLGLAAGAALWGAVVLLPLLGYEAFAHHARDLAAALDPDFSDRWILALAFTLGPNILLFTLGSVLFGQRPEERRAAARSTRDALAAGPGPAPSERQLTEQLEAFLGEAAARRELDRARRELPAGPLAAPDRARLAERLEANLSGLFGPVVARAILGRAPADAGAELAAQLRFLEERAREVELVGPARTLELVRRYLAEVLDALPIGLVAVDAQGEVILWNRAVAELSERPASATAGHGLSAGGPLGAALAELLERGVEADELRLTLLGAPRILEVRRTLLGRDHPEGAVILVDDATRERAMAAHLAHEDRLASVGRLAAGVAHEIGNPLAGVLMVAKNLAREDEPEDLAERLGLIVREAERIQGIVRSLLTFSRAEPVHPAPRTAVDLAEVAREALELVSLTAHGVTGALEIAPDLRVLGHRPHLVQLLVNLLANAFDASPAGARVRITAARHGAEVHLGITDAGPGMSPETLARIFEPFFTTKAPGRGTGLGLAVVRNLVDEHGGRLEVESSPGRGSTFTVVLPGAES